MNETTNSAEEFESAVYRENSDKFTFEQLRPYFGKQVAWSWDGKEILASGDTYEEVNEKLEDRGIPFNRVVFGYVDDPEVGNF